MIAEEPPKLIAGDTTPGDHPRSWRSLLPRIRLEVLAVVSLVATFAWRGRSGLNPEAWHNDDSWVVAAVSLADSPRELLELGFTHPGFNALLRLLSTGPEDSVAYQVVPYVGAMVSLVVMFHVIRHRLENTVLAWVAVLPAATSFLLVRYAMSVKPYTLEVLAFAVALLALQRWERVTNRQLVRWVVLLVPVVTLSFRISFVSAVAGFGLWWARKMSFRQLVGLGAAHAVVLLPIYLYLQSNFDQDELTDWWERRPGVFSVDGQPQVVSLVEQFRRVTRVLIDGPAIVGWLLVLLIIIGAMDGILARRAAGVAASAGLVLAMMLSALTLSPFGPEILGNQRIDLWLAPALLLLAVDGVVFLVRRVAAVAGRRGSTASGSRRLPQYGVAAVAVVMVVTPVVADRVLDHVAYPDENLKPNLAFVLHEVSTNPNTIVVGPRHDGVELQLATEFPETSLGVEPDPSNMRGIVVRLVPPVVRANTFANQPGILDGVDRVIGMRLGSREIPPFRSQLRDAGFVRLRNPEFPLIDVWARVEGDL